MSADLLETDGSNIQREAIVEVDLEAFKAAGQQAYEVLNLTEIREQIYQELGR